MITANRATTHRDDREVIREEPVMRVRILAALRDGPLTVPEIAAATSPPPKRRMSP